MPLRQNRWIVQCQPRVHPHCPAVTAPVSSSMSTPIAVLVVEDEVMIRVDVADYLTHRGFEVYEAAATPIRHSR